MFSDRIQPSLLAYTFYDFFPQKAGSHHPPNLIVGGIAKQNSASRNGVS